MSHANDATPRRDDALDGFFERHLPGVRRDDLARARARRRLVTAADAVLASAPARAARMRIVTALAFAATAAAAATVATSWQAQRGSTPDERAPAPVVAPAAPAAPAVHAGGPRTEEVPRDVPPSVEVAAPAPPPAVKTATDPRAARASAHASDPPAAPSVETPASPAPEPATPRAGARFAEALRAYVAGDYGTADALFGAFADDFPEDARAEDAAFLRTDARAKRGDAAGARAAARAYLHRFPQGLRRPEIERLAGEGL